MDFNTLLSKNCRVLIDTCSMMNRQFQSAMEKMVPVLERSGNRLIIPESCVNELRKHAKATTLSDKAINAANALNVLRKNSEYISIRGDQADSTHADNVILRVCNQFKTQYYLIVITEDKDLRSDICNINAQKSVRGNKIEVVSIEYIAYYKENTNQCKHFSIQTKVSEKPDTILKIKSVPKAGDRLITSSDCKLIYLKDEIKAGGEGVVFDTDIDEYVAKIYHQNKLSSRKKEKIDLLVKSGLVIDGVCLPEKSLFNEQGEFVGYLMKKASGKSLDCSFFKGERGIMRHFPNWTRLDLVTLSITILSTINKLHRLGIIIGDINGANILVNSPNSVFFVDTDSFQVNDLPCPVGTEEFTAPEIQGKDYKSFLRTVGNENFAVATLLFRLLMFGVSPYAQKGGESIAHNIQSGNFSFPFKEKSNGKIPEGDWKFFWSHLFFPLKEQFYSTFKKGGHCYGEEERPDVSKWLKLLGDYKQQLADGTIANYDGQSIKMFPKSYKRIPNETYIVCDLCKQDVPLRFIKSHAGKHYCWHCLEKSTIVHCKSCGEQMEYTTYRKIIDEIPAPSFCKKCKDKYKMELEEREKQARIEAENRRAIEEEKRRQTEFIRNSIYKTITCNCCGKKFNITNGEKNYYVNKGLVLPKRCPECRSQGCRRDNSRSSYHSKYYSSGNTYTSSNNSNKSSGGCFITTAVCDFYGKPDDCYELTMLRGFRDSWLAEQVDGKELINKYYVNAPDLVTEMKKSENYERYCMVLMNDFINPCVSLINQGRNEECKALYIEGVDYLINELKN
jgi:serine/threonine protein kinase/rRNA-processing protein FCF1